MSVGYLHILLENLNLETPLTHYTQTNTTRRTYEHYEQLLDTLKRRLKAEQLQIIQADKGPGLLVIHNTTLTDIYKQYLQTNATTVSASTYNESVRRLKLFLYLMDLEIGPEAVTDDRPPTLYFKIKTHKPTFITHEAGQPEVYTYLNGAKNLTNIARPIINHRNSITTHTSSCLRKFITPIIAESKYLTKDIYETIAKLCKHGPPNQIYAGDIEQFYPTHHTAWSLRHSHSTTRA